MVLDFIFITGKVVISVNNPQWKILLSPLQFLKQVQLYDVEVGCFFHERLHLKLQSSHKYTDIFCVCMHRVLRATYSIANIIRYFSKFVKNHFGRKFKKIFRALKIPEFNSKCFTDAKYKFLLKWVN